MYQPRYWDRRGSKQRIWRLVRRAIVFALAFWLGVVYGRYWP
jgi:hypothetical protein